MPQLPIRLRNHSFLVPTSAALPCFHLHLLKVGIAISTSSGPTALGFLSFSEYLLLQVLCRGSRPQPLLRHHQVTQKSPGTQAGTVPDSTLTSFNPPRRWEHPRMQETDASLAAKS
eukprot:s5215_g1.t1